MMFTPVSVILPATSWLWRQVSSCWNNLTAVSISLTLLAFALLLDYKKWRKRSSRCPPGPAPLPFIGNLLLLDRNNPDKTALYLKRHFGPVVSFQAGWKNYVLLNGFKIIKEALGQKAEDFVDRPSLPLLYVIGHAKKCEGIFLATCSNGWREQRRFCVSTLKNFGMGKKSLEKRISEEAGYLCSEIKSKEGSPFDPHNLIYRAVGNIICGLTFGARFEYSDETFLKLMHLTNELLKGLMRILPQIMAAGSWFSCVPGPHHKVKKIYDDFSSIVKEIVDEHKKTRDPTFPRDLIDAFLEEIEKAKGNQESSFNEQNLFHLLYDLFAAGTETTSSTLLWGILKLVLHPEVQRGVHEEIDTVIGRVKSPTMEDQLNLPYTSAVIHEIQRCADIAPISLPFVTHKDTELADFVIPKESVVVNHLSSVLKDETMWEKPHEFYPEHFLDTNRQLVKREAFLPFSAGRHSCPGEQMAKMELFIFFTSLLQHFTFHIPENSPRPTEEREFAITVTPAPFQICAIPR
ncbi:cytochrome P450 2D14-like [Sceloporus undulatus]|uniref:cytochrome P450 2D14-like n=1 Tax=Sceloporus undulatus TaxID=8520 RepID=UPI001C4AB098|nr:cytochrome P450 2D14-like [Sceloporus undulatus]XP_042323689.1 cytochrome P450 2D14-like [Sceloporus undulatus]